MNLFYYDERALIFSPLKFFFSAKDILFHIPFGLAPQSAHHLSIEVTPYHPLTKSCGIRNDSCLIKDDTSVWQTFPDDDDDIIRWKCPCLGLVVWLNDWLVLQRAIFISKPISLSSQQRSTNNTHSFAFIVFVANTPLQEFVVLAAERQHSSAHKMRNWKCVFQFSNTLIQARFYYCGQLHNLTTTTTIASALDENTQ